jgi:non-reducing end alpha-L-arabinofuranosidase
VPSRQWTSVVDGTAGSSKTFSVPIAPGASVSATFRVTSGPAALNGDLVGNASWTNQASGAEQTETTAEKVRNVFPIKINEFRASNRSLANSTDSFIELYNAGDRDVDISNWNLIEHSTQEAIFSSVKFPAATKVAAHGFYLLGLSNSGLAIPARAGDSTISVRSTTGINAGDTITIDTGANAETRKVASVGSEAGSNSTLWQPLPEGPVITIPAGSTNVPVTSTVGFAISEKIALGYGATYPAVAQGFEKYEVATVTAVGKPGTQAWLGADAPAGSSNIKVTSIANISVGDKIRLDIDSVGHGIETVTVTKVGTQATRTNLLAEASAGATSIRVRRLEGFAVGDKINVGTPANRETVTVTGVDGSGVNRADLEISPALAHAHISGETVMNPGTGLDLAAPLKFNHASNLPFSDRGTGISFEPATGFAHSSNEPVQALGTGITLDRPLASGHAIDATVRDAAVTSAGYQGTPQPNQWFGGPVLSPAAGAIVLRDAAGMVVDSLNYGLLVDPWAAEGYQAASGPGETGCRIPALGPTANYGQTALAAGAFIQSAGRFPDGADTDSNCADFHLQAATTLPIPSPVGATNIKVVSVAGFQAGETVLIDSGANLETAVIATVGTAGATSVSAATAVGATAIPVASPFGFSPGQTITIDSGKNSETATVASIERAPAPGITVAAPLNYEHASGAQLSGTGITFTATLNKAHASGAQVTDGVPTPGAPNRYYLRPH